MLLNQAVLLRGVNDSAEPGGPVRTRLRRRRVPYYLHQLDRVAGAAHFEVGDEQALALLHADWLARLPGYLVPKLVREIAGDPGRQDAMAAACTPPPPS